MPLLTYQNFPSDREAGPGGAVREQLLDFISNLSPTDTPLFNELGSVRVNSGYIEHLEDELTAATTNAWTEGAAATDPALTVPTRVASIVQAFQKHYHVSGRSQAVEHAGMSTPLAYQETKAMKEFKRDIELALHRGSAVTGATDAAPQFAGLLNRISTYATSSSGTTLTESVFNDLLTLTFATPSNLRSVYANMFVKRTINGYTTNVQRTMDARAFRQADLVNIYESEMGVLAIHKSRDQLQSADKTTSGNSFVAIDPSFFQVGWLRTPSTHELGKDGDRIRKFMVGECTLLAKNQRAGVAATQLVAYLP